MGKCESCGDSTVMTLPDESGLVSCMKCRLDNLSKTEEVDG